MSTNTGRPPIRSTTFVRDVFRLTTFRTPLLAGVCVAIVAALVKAYDNYGSKRDIVELLRFNDSCYGTFTMIVGLVMGFRTNQAYARFWEGATCIYLVMGSWFDAASALFVFCSKSPEVAEQRAEFQHNLVRLISMCSALMFAELENQTSDIESKDFVYDLIDPLGIDKETLKTIHRSDKGVEVVFHMVHQLMVAAMDNGVLVTPPPILAQAFADVSAALVKFHEAEKLAQIPFPFSFRCVATFLLVVHWMLTPVVVCLWVSSSASAGFFSFLLTFSLWSLNAIAWELDNPFAQKSNGFNCEQMQHNFNKRLVTCLVLAEKPPPSLSATAIRDAHRISRGTRERRSSVISGFSGRKRFASLRSVGNFTSKAPTWASLDHIASAGSAEVPPDDCTDETPELVDLEAVLELASHGSRTPDRQLTPEERLDDGGSAGSFAEPGAIAEHPRMLRTQLDPGAALVLDESGLADRQSRPAHVAPWDFDGPASVHDSRAASGSPHFAVAPDLPLEAGAGAGMRGLGHELPSTNLSAKSDLPNWKVPSQTRLAQSAFDCR